MKKLIYTAAGLTALTLASCGSSEWKVEGKIDGAAGKDIILEAANEAGAWYGVDTMTVADDGTFAFNGAPAGHPEIYRVRIGSEAAYFPIDSLETITLTGKIGNLANGYTIAGSPEADNMQRVNQLLDSITKAGGEQAIVGNEQLKRRLADVVLRNPAGMTAYYTIFRRVGNTQVFDPAVSFDNRIIGAVANAFNEKRPSDPRTKMLTELFIRNRRNTQATDTIVATEIKHPDIALADINGKVHRLSDETGRGNVVILNFTAYSAQEGPALNVRLNEIYNAHKNQGLQIFQVGFDPDEYLWRQSAKNIPWIAVYNPTSNGDAVLMTYNVGALPALFIFNRNGDLVERVTDLSKLDATVAKYL